MTKQRRIVLAIAAVAILAAVAAVCITLFGRSGQPISGATGGVALDKNAVDFQSEETVNSDPQTIRFPGYPDITIGQEATVVPIVLTNPEGNPCLFQFEVTMDSTQDVLLSSDWVEPGKALEGVSLSSPLNKGNHIIHIQINTRSLGGQQTMNGGNVQALIHVT